MLRCAIVHNKTVGIIKCFIKFTLGGDWLPNNFTQYLIIIKYSNRKSCCNESVFIMENNTFKICTLYAGHFNVRIYYSWDEFGIEILNVQTFSGKSGPL